MSSSVKSKNTQHERNNVKSKTLKPFGFCCSINDLDPLMDYNKQKSLYKSPSVSTHAINESPTLKFRAQFVDSLDFEQKKRIPKMRLLDIGDHKRKNYMRQNAHKLYQNQFGASDPRIHAGSSYDDLHHSEDLHDKWVKYLLHKPIQWYLEDEIASAKDTLWEQKQKAYNAEMDKNINIGKQKLKLFMKSEVNTYPRWYQDFSIDQMKNLMMLQCVIQKDYEEMVTGRTQRTLAGIGITSTFFTLSSDIIQKLQESRNCNAIEFLREIYKLLTGNYFEEEGYKKFYDCNERIILSAIAFLTLPEAVVELHERLPLVIMPKLPSKPIPPTSPVRQKMKSPYEEELFTRPNWVPYYNQLQRWQEQHQLIPIPNVILPPRDCILTTYKYTETKSDGGENKPNILQNFYKNNQHNIPTQKAQKKNISINSKQKYNNPVTMEAKTFANSSTNNPTKGKQKQNIYTNKEKHNIDTKGEKFKQEVDVIKNTINNEEHALDIPPLPNGSKVFDFTINGISEKPGPVEYKICGVLQPPQPNKKSWLGEKHAHYIISGAADDPPMCPITYEMTGVANVTPTNSDERFFAVLKLGDGTKKIYPSGRSSLSPKWQEWLQNADEEFRKVEREANKMIKSIEAVTRLVFPGPTCDSCCSCRQTRKSYLKAKETKTPYFVIDTIAEDNKNHKCIVGSMAMHSPAPTPPESTVNLLEVIASEDVLKTNILINGVTNEKGETQYFISGVKKDMVRVPGRVVERPPPRPPRNVPACVCAIQQIFTKGLTPTISHDHIPWTKDVGLCFGKKFRPNETAALSCKMYPGDKSCRRNPFMHDIIKLKRRAERAKQEAQKPPFSLEKKRMYSIADFQPCGDEHGMGVCGAPWGVLHTLTPQELAEQEKLRKEILRGPPCGIKPGRAVCKGPFGERIPQKPQKIEIEEEIPGEFDEEDFEIEEEEEKEEEVPKEMKEKKKEKKRDKKCHMSPDSIEDRKKVVEKKVEKFIPDPTYPGYDDPWNIFRTAPSEKESETDFKTLLKLSSPKPSTPVESKTLVDENEKVQQSSLQKDGSKVGSAKISTRDSRKKAPSSKQGNLSARPSKKHISAKSGSNVRIVKSKSKSVDRGGTQKKFPKSTGTRARSEEALNKVIKRDKADDRIGEQKLLTPSRSKSSHRKVNEKTMSSRNLKKSEQKKTGSSHKRLSKRFDTKSKRNGKSTLRESKDNVTISKKTSTNRKLNKTNKQSSREGVEMRKSSRKQSLSMGAGRKKVSKSFNLRRRSIKRDKRKDIQSVQDTDSDPKKQIQNLKTLLRSSELYPYDVKPIDLPKEAPGKCTLEYEYAEDTTSSVQTDKEADAQLPSKGPCGWRTKSEQQLPTKKTLVYLAEPDYPPETIPVRPGGKPCVCRENREKKKVLLYNIGGLIGGKQDDIEAKDLLKKKKDEDDKKLQVIDGLIYHTPPPSPRRSDEYVPEYDLHESPYDMCLTKRKELDLKFLEQHSGPASVLSKALKNNVSCGCNEYIDTYGIQTLDEDDEKTQAIKELDKTRQELIEAKSPKERWKLALKDVGLIDYFTRCRDSMPCWLKCAKFNKVGCKIPRPKLKIKRPVCECKYERKILEHKEENMKWKERRQRLKSLKKQPFLNIMDTSKPVVTDTKLMISGVKRIPKQDEYVDDVKYCITGVAENHTELPPKPIVGGVQMSTPIHTPEPSVEQIPCVCLHRHWSPINIPPGPLPKPREIMLAENKRRQEAAKKAYSQIHAPLEVYDTHDTHSCKQTCDQNLILEGNEGIDESGNVISKTMADNRTKARRINPSIQEQQLKNKKQQLKNKNKLDTKNPVAQKSSYNPQKLEYKEVEANIQNRSHDPQKPRGKEIKGDTDQQNISTNSNTEGIEDIPDDTKTDLMTITQKELKKMAAEGFLFAKLPKCFLMPQLQYWLIYRKGIALSDADKDNSVRKSILMWNMLDVTRPPRVEPPSLKMTKVQLRKLTFDRAEETKEKIKRKKEIFHSQVRKGRVLYSRSMWNTMDYGKFPVTSFKQAYFTYMASKEADGHVFKPWLRSEVRETTHC